MTGPLDQRQLVTTWGIPDQYMGQTVAMLRRVNQQVRRSGRPVELLTFDGARDVAELTANLRSRDAWTDGLVLRNLFEDLRAWDAEGTLPDRFAGTEEPVPAPELDVEVAREDVTRWCRRTYDADGRLVTSQMFRADGSLLARDAPVDVAGKRRRHQQLFDADGRPWRRLSSFAAYFTWLDALLGDDEAVLVNESKAAARFVSRYPNPRVTLVHVFHESHLAEPGDPWSGKLLLQHRQTVPHLDRWDAAVFLTRRQRDDVALRFGESGNLHTVPNASAPAGMVQKSWRGEPDRPPRAVMVARLDPIKRIEQAVLAVARVRGAGGRGRGVTLDVYGKDEGARPTIEQAIAETGSGAYVALRGHTSDAPGEFANASFSLMTSTTEAQSLVLLESMAQGCVPISYDIRYGPAELVIDGETGFLVPDGDLDALTGAITGFLALPARKVRRLREAARERVAAFSDEEAFARWTEVRRQAVQRRPVRGQLGVELVGVQAGVVEPLLRLEAELGWTWTPAAGSVADPGPPEAQLLLVARRDGRPWRRPLEVAELGEGRLRVRGDLDPAAVGTGRQVFDVFAELRRGSSVRRVRLTGDHDLALASGQLVPTASGNLSLRRG